MISYKYFSTFIGNHDVLTFILGGLSKSLALPQMKLSWIILNGPAGLVEEAKKRLEVIADTYLSVNAPVQNALSSWLPAADSIQEQIKDRILANYTFLKELQQKNRLSVLLAEGGWYAVIDMPGMEDDLVLRMLEDQKVYIHPGYFYDFDQMHCCVVSLLTPEDVMKEGIQKLIDFQSGGRT